MKYNDLPPGLQTEFNEFVDSPPQEVPSYLKRKILSEVELALNPSKSQVFSKLFIVVLVVGLLNLTLCPQFGIGPIRHSGLMHFFMSFGEYGCRIACGLFFLGSGVFIASLLLKPEDIKVIRSSRLLFISSLSAIFLTAFVALGGDIYFEAAFFWLLGTVLGGLSSIEIGWAIRRTKWA